jgi:hypothetical protein
MSNAGAPFNTPTPMKLSKTVIRLISDDYFTIKQPVATVQTHSEYCAKKTNDKQGRSKTIDFTECNPISA